jgi:EF-P beta-lysylation protein EpmB
VGAKATLQLKNLITDPAELLQLLEIDPALLPSAIEAAKLFPLRVPRSFVARMQKGNVRDPLLRQVLPLGLELNDSPGFTRDPLNEKVANPIPGLLHKYHGRVLLTVVGSCAINCRYCFRRSFAYDENNPGTKGWERVVDYIARDSTITEVILSGGDPLVAPDEHLAALSQKLATIPHVKTLRIHSRLPIVSPERVTAELINWFTASRLRPVLVVHCNHPQEIDLEVRAALQKLKQAGITLLNQAVLLREINDSAEVLIELSEALFDMGVLPYYLHLLDKVQGTAHFDVAEERAQKIIGEMMRRLPGYLVPKLVREVAGAPTKLPANLGSVTMPALL